MLGTLVRTGPPGPDDLPSLPPGGLSWAARQHARQHDQAARLRAGLPVGWPPPSWVAIEAWTELVAAVRAFCALPRKWRHLLGELRFRLGWY